jgi:hypothetical protein
MRPPGAGLIPPPPTASGDEEWVEVNEAVAPDAGVITALGGKGGPPAGDWGRRLLEDLEVPEEMQDEIHSALTKNERINWADRPQMQILMHKARRFALTGGLIGGIGFLGLPIGGFALWKVAGSIIPFLALCFFGLILGAVAFFAITSPSRQRKNGPKRACFVLTNRRLLLHPGRGTQTIHGRGGSTTVLVGAQRLGVISYSGLELTRLWRIESKRFEGCGDLIFSRDILDEPAGGILWAIKDVRKVEKMVREQLLHPIIDKLLRGEKLTKEEKGESPQDKEKDEEEGDVEAPDANIKDFVRGGRSGGGGGADANTKDLQTAAERSLEKVPADLKREVQAELTAGERVLWIAEPEGRTKGRGMLGAIVGAAHRREPDYYLYAITNRRVLLFAEKGSKVGTTIRLGHGDDVRGPITYYSPHLLGAGLEEDKRIPSGGSIVFRQVKVTITTRDKQGRVSVRVEKHFLGLLRIRNYISVARLLYETLIAPVRGL